MRSSPGGIRMIDVGEKEITHRIAVAQATVSMQPKTLEAILGGKIEKGNVLEAARIAGIQAAKETSRILPLCHPLPLEHVEIEFTSDPKGGRIEIRANTETHWKTGVEMEAMTAVSAAALCIYDMCKSIDRWMTIEKIELLEKRGGKSGTWKRKD